MPEYFPKSGGQFTGKVYDASGNEITGGGSGVTDHGALTGLSDDDHTQYHNDTRGDARYSPLGHTHSGVYQPADADLDAVAGLSTTGLVKRTGAGTATTVTDNSSNWDSAYSDRLKWDGGSTGLVAATGRTSLGLGDSATKNVGTGAGDVAAGNHAHSGVYDPAGTASSAVSSHTSSYDHTKLHDAATVTDTDTVDLSVMGQQISAAVRLQMSLTSDGSGVKLSGDSSSPGNSKYYGTNSGGTKGFHDFTSGLTQAQALKLSSFRA